MGIVVTLFNSDFFHNIVPKDAYGLFDAEKCAWLQRPRQRLSGDRPRICPITRNTPYRIQVD